MSSELTLKQARDMALNTMKKAEAERAACAEREAREHACPNCAEKDATIARHVRTTYEIELNRNTRLRQQQARLLRLEYLVEQRDARIAELKGLLEDAVAWVRATDDWDDPLPDFGVSDRLRQHMKDEEVRRD